MDETHRQQVARRVVAAREAKGWSQGELAAAAGVAPNTVLAIEQAKTTRPKTVRAVHDALGVAVEEDPPDPPLFSLEVETVRNMVGLYLEQLDPGPERQDAVRRILRAMAGKG